MLYKTICPECKQEKITTEYIRKCYRCEVLCQAHALMSLDEIRKASTIERQKKNQALTGSSVDCAGDVVEK